MKLLTEWCPINATKELISESKRMHDGKIIASNRTDKPHGAQVEVIIPISS